MAPVVETRSRPGTETGAPSVGTYLVLTGDGPMLVVLRNGADPDTALRRSLGRRGHAKFIACPVSPEDVRRAYGTPFQVIADGLTERHPVRVLDFDGRRVFGNLSLRRVGPPVPMEARS
ncbi:MAG TPA: hypothetical protein VLT32_13315 [Candidatus Sulfomarinibacteraceae bacterium]|nr:hypothetical protein [Candidatus Sulfomarinibacteraceae bacterium]